VLGAIGTFTSMGFGKKGGMGETKGVGIREKVQSTMAWGEEERARTISNVSSERRRGGERGGVATARHKHREKRESQMKRTKLKSKKEAKTGAI